MSDFLIELLAFGLIVAALFFLYRRGCRQCGGHLAHRRGCTRIRLRSRK